MPVTVRNTDILFNDGSTQSTAASVIPSSFNAIGSTLWATNWSTSNVVSGNTVAGSSLLYVTGGSFFGGGSQAVSLSSNIIYSMASNRISGQYNGNSGAIQPGNTSTLPGTWRILGVANARYSQWDGGTYNVTNVLYVGLLVQRIS